MTNQSHIWAKCNDIPSRGFWDIMFTRDWARCEVIVSLTFDLWPSKSNQCILESKQTWHKWQKTKCLFWMPSLSLHSLSSSLRHLSFSLSIQQSLTESHCLPRSTTQLSCYPPLLILLGCTFLLDALSSLLIFFVILLRPYLQWLLMKNRKWK